MVKNNFLFIDNTSVLGGAEKVLLDIIKTSRQKGIGVGVACSPFAHKFIKLIKKNGGEVFELKTGEEAERWRGLNLISPFMALYLFRMFLFIKKMRIKYTKMHVLVQLYKEQILSGLILRGKDIPLIWIQHPHPPPWLRYSPLRHLYARIANRYVFKVVTGSESVKRALVKMGIREDRITVIPNGIDVPENIEGNRSKSDFCRWYDISRETTVISTHGRLHSQKGQAYLLVAIKELADEIPSIKLIIMGEGRYRSYLEQLTLALNLTQHVIFAGYYPDPGEILSISDLWVSPSLDEGFSLSILESMAYALPVIATACGGTKELIKDGYDGLLIPPGDAKAIVLAVREILFNKEKAKELGQSARRKIVDYYYLDRFINDFLKALNAA